MSTQAESVDTSDTPASERRARQLTPDDEAMLLMVKVIERAAVAKSFAKIATGFFVANAAVAAQQLKVAADAKLQASGLDSGLARMKKIARAAAEAAVHVAKHRADTETEAAEPPARSPEQASATT